jgi:glycosyltransferase involved in cell wall biosynthesis
MIVVSDIFDPLRGSEFQVANKAIRASIQVAETVRVLTLRRSGNLHNTMKWMDQFLNKDHIFIEYREPRFSDKNGSHANKMLLFLDLLLLYCYAFKIRRDNEVIWKCGQVNIIFNFLLCFVSGPVIIGPLSGLEFTKAVKYPRIPVYTKIYYVLYGIFVFSILMVVKLLAVDRKKKVILCATMGDFRRISTFGFGMIGHLTEIDIEALALNRGTEARRQETVLWSGAFIHRKNPLYALDILKVFLTRYEWASATIVGDGPLASEVNNLLDSWSNELRSRINLLNLVDRPAFIEILRSSGLLIVTSIREANSVLVFESLSLGVPVVAPASSGLADSTGWLSAKYEMGRTTVQSICDLMLERLTSDDTKVGEFYLKEMLTDEKKLMREVMEFVGVSLRKD